MSSQRESGQPDFASVALLHDGRRIETSEDAAAFLGQPLGRMIYMLYRAPDAQRYRAFEIPKRSGGMRLIHSPNGLIREAQTKLHWANDTTKAEDDR